MLESLALAACLVMSCGAWAAGKPQPQPITKQAYDAEKARITAQYDADRKLCASTKGQVQDVCEIEATGRQKALLAELEAKLKPSPEATQKAKNVTAEANFDVAKAKCKPLRDGAKDRCIKEAKAAREAAIRQAKVEKVQETGGAFANSSAHRTIKRDADS